MLRILVCGDRNWTDYFAVRDTLKAFKETSGIEYIIEGEASGADTFGRIAAEELDIPCAKFPAKWAEFGLSAGPKRNLQMLIEGKPNLVLAFHNDIKNSKGTMNMIEQSKRAGLKVILYYHELQRKEL